jgi:hypothetical protein
MISSSLHRGRRYIHGKQPEYPARAEHGRDRHPARGFLDSLSGHGDPGMFGRMFHSTRTAGCSESALAIPAGHRGAPT